MSNICKQTMEMLVIYFSILQVTRQMNYIFKHGFKLLRVLKLTESDNHGTSLITDAVISINHYLNMVHLTHPCLRVFQA